MSGHRVSPPASADASSTSDRALAPDLARGAMLLLIGYAHAPLFVLDVDHGPRWAHEIVASFHLVFVHNHVRPLFAFLLGYALVQLMNRRLRRGAELPPTLGLLRRRGWWLIAFGFVHIVLLVPIDILAVYGLATVLLVGLVRVRDRTLLLLGVVSLVPSVGSTTLSVWGPLTLNLPFYTVASVAAGNRGVVELAVSRVIGWPIGLVLGTLAVIPGVIFGIWAARRGILEKPAGHRRFLARMALGCTGMSIIGAVPAVLIDSGIWPDPPDGLILIASILQPLTGYVGGIALAGIVALIAIPVGQQVGPAARAIAALGQRSLTFYLFQSVVFVVAFFPYGFRLQDDLGLTGAVLLATATWVVSAIIAELMRRADHRGPAEILLRRLTYGAGGLPVGADRHGRNSTSGPFRRPR